MKNSTKRMRMMQVLAVLALVFATTAASAQRSMEERRNSRQSQSRGQQVQENQYPNATRQEPGTKASSRMSQRLQKMISAYNDDKPEDAIKYANEILAADNANEYDKSVAARILGATKLADDAQGALDAFRQALEFNGLNNNDHFEVMWFVAQLQGQENQFSESVQTIDRLIAETAMQKSEWLGFKGVILYQLERYPEAIQVLEAAMAGAEQPQEQWQQLMMAAYAETGQQDKALQLAEDLASKSPDDKRSQLNLASMYIQSDQEARAIEVYERLRAAGKLSEANEYRNLMSLYLGSEGKERDAIAVINEGLEKGAMKPDHETYSLLGQAYYFSDQIPQAIEAYKKAAPLAPNGEAYLNLAKTLWAEGRIPEAKQAAQQALDKGVRAPQEARTILNL